MKYKFTSTSRNKVLIELISETKAEENFGSIFDESNDDHQFTAYNNFEVAISAWNPKAQLVNLHFVQFPDIGLCTFELMNSIGDGV